MIEVNNRVLDVDAEKIVRDLSEVVTNGKLSDIRVSAKEIQLNCPVHADGHEHRPSCFIRKEDFIGHCFTCNSIFNVVTFTAHCLDCNYETAIHWLISRYANDYVKKQLNLTPIDLSENNETVETYLDESILDTFEDYHPYMVQRKLTEDIIKRFKIKYDPKTRCIVFPVRDRNGNLKYLTRRSVVSKKFIIDKAANKKDIYLLNEVLNEREVIVCESQLNALTCYEYGYKGIALLGCGTTKEQMQELNNTGIKHFILMYDNDTAGREGAEKFKKLINKNKFVTDIIMPKGKDVNDCTKDEFISLLKQNGVINENS